MKLVGGWKSDAVHAYLYTDLSAAPSRAKEMLSSRPVLQPQQHAHPSVHHPREQDMRCGRPKHPQREESEVSDFSEEWQVQVAQDKLQAEERRTGLTLVQRARVRRQVAAGGVVEALVLCSGSGKVEAEPQFGKPESLLLRCPSSCCPDC